MKCHLQGILGVINSGRLDGLILIILGRAWGILDARNNLILGVSWRLNRWIQDGWSMKTFKKFSYCGDCVYLVDGIIAMGWHKTGKVSIFFIREGSDIWEGHDKSKVSLNKNIFRYGGLGEIYIILEVKGTCVDLWKIFIWEDGECIYLNIQICIELFKEKGMLIVEVPDQFP